MYKYFLSVWDLFTFKIVKNFEFQHRVVFHKFFMVKGKQVLLIADQDTVMFSLEKENSFQISETFKIPEKGKTNQSIKSIDFSNQG